MSHHTVKYSSGHLVPGVSLPQGPSFHQIALTWDLRHPEAEGSCHIDPNTCKLDELGDRTICTEMAMPPRDIKLKLTKQKAGHQAYAMEWRLHGSTAEYQEAPLRLVSITSRGEDPQVRLLVLKPDYTIDRIIDLHE